MTDIARRRWILALSTLIGICIGVVGDYTAGDDLSPSLKDVPVALLLSPLVVTLGGRTVTTTGLANAFLVGGLLFWPVYLVLAWLWLKRRVPWIWLAVILWCAQGFFQVLHRLAAIMSV